MKIGIIGAGFFGIAAAIKLKEKFKDSKIHIFDKKSQILSGSSGKNQFRWHKGYHYPRSQETISECLESYKSFKKYLNKFTLNTENYYAIAKRRSLTNSKQFMKICKKNKLYLKKTKLNLLKEKKISSVFKVKEEILNIRSVKHFLKRYLKKKKIVLHLNYKVKNIKKLSKDFDKLILATYSDNEFLTSEIIQKNVKFQLVEKIVVKVPDIYKKKSIVVLDGNFMCIDPYHIKSHSLLGSVKDSIIKESIGKPLSLTKLEKNYLNKEFVKKPVKSKFKQIKKKFSSFFNYFDDVEYAGSFFVIRCTKITKEDARKSEIQKSGKIIKIFSGKWVSCFNVAEKLTRII